MVLAPVALMLFVDHTPHENLALAFSLVTGLIATSLMIVAVLLPARMRSILAAFGVEWVLRCHRMVALSAAALVVAHIGCVFVGDPRGLSILNLPRQPRPVWAATTSTVALLALIAFATRRRRHRPRYEGWRLWHVLLATTALVAAALHVLWLHHLTCRRAMLAYFVVLLAVAVAASVRRWIWRPLRARRRAYLVETVRRDSGDAITVVLRAHGHRGLPFRAGQFAWMKIGQTPFVFEEHPFTIASTAERPDRVEFTVKALGDFSEILAGLRAGRRVFLDGPYGGFTIDGLRSPGIVCIAGGIGITPMLSILRTLADRRDWRSHLLLVSARSVEDLVLREEVARLQGLLRLGVVEVVTSPPPGWMGAAGRIDGALLDRCLPRLARHHDYFICGPNAMVVSVTGQLRRRGIPMQRIHTELFDVV